MLCFCCVTSFQKALSHFNDAFIDCFGFLSAAEHRHRGHITTLWSCYVDHICNCCSDDQFAHTVSKVVSQKTKQGGWKTPSSVVVGGVSVNRLDRTFPICLLRQWWFILHYCCSPGIIILPSAMFWWRQKSMEALSSFTITCYLSAHQVNKNTALQANITSPDFYPTSLYLYRGMGPTAETLLLDLN